MIYNLSNIEHKLSLHIRITPLRQLQRVSTLYDVEKHRKQFEINAYQVPCALYLHLYMSMLKYLSLYEKLFFFTNLLLSQLHNIVKNVIWKTDSSEIESTKLDLKTLD